MLTLTEIEKSAAMTGNWTIHHINWDSRTMKTWEKYNPRITVIPSMNFSRNSKKTMEVVNRDIKQDFTVP